MKVVRFLLFNGFTESTINRAPQSILGNKRLAAVLTEFQHLVSILFFPMIFAMIILLILQSSKVITDETTSIIWGILLSWMSCIILNKDFYGGQSIVHRSLGYQVVDIKTGQPASKVRCFLRNMTFVVLIIEVIPLLVTPKRRIGDWIAGTKVIEVPPSEPKEILVEMQKTPWTNDLKWTLFLNFIFVVVNIVYFIQRASP